MIGLLRKLTVYCTFFFLIFGFGTSFSQEQKTLRLLDLQKNFKEANNFLLSFKNDSALILLNNIAEALASTDQLNTRFGVEVQLRQAEALEKDHKDEVAIQKLLTVAELSSESGQWNVFTNANLSLARLHEKIGRPRQCLNNLRIAESTIKTYQVDSIYPRFAIRISSYHRIFSDRDSSIYYAREVLRTAPKYGLTEENAVGHLLLGMLLGRDSFKVAAGHFTEAGRVWKEVEDFTGYGFTQNNLSRLYYKNKNFKEALRYNDSTLVAAALSVGVGHDDYSLYATAYKHRAAIHEILDQPDSALHYIRKGYELELQEINKKSIEKVIEVEASYEDEKKQQTIEEQKQLIKFERERRYTLIGIISMILLFMAGLAYYYFKLRRVNSQTEAQAKTIRQKNQELSKSLSQQRVLQSEVHHRVKNNLQVIISLLDLQMEDIDHPKVKRSIEAMSGRIYSMAAIHEILYQQEDMAQVSLYDYVENLCLHFSNFSLEEEKPDFNLNIGNYFLNLETSMPLGIILTELLTNSLKYARVEDKTLKIDINVQKEADVFSLRFKDNGPGFADNQLKEREKGLGTYLLNSMTRQLNGQISSKNDNGASFEITFKEKITLY